MSKLKENVKNELEKYNLLSIVEYYLNKSGLINIDYDDINLLLENRKIKNFYYDKIDINNEIKFNFSPNNDTHAIVIIESNNYVSMKDIEKILNAIRNSFDSLDIILGCYLNEKIDDIKVLEISA